MFELLYLLPLFESYFYFPLVFTPLIPLFENYFYFPLLVIV
jgi:hypothetical protein